MWRSYKGKTAVRGLHCVPEQRRHIEVLRQQEDVTEVLNRRGLHRDWHLGLRDLLENELENVFHVLQ